MSKEKASKLANELRNKIYEKFIPYAWNHEAVLILRNIMGQLSQIKERESSKKLLATCNELLRFLDERDVKIFVKDYINEIKTTVNQIINLLEK